MSRYSTDNVLSDYVDPVAFVPNKRCRFELDANKLCYMPNMRLLDVGCTADAQVAYNRGLGALSIIKNIRLMDARTELSSLRTVAPYMFFKNSNHTNSENKSQKSWMRRNALGLEIDSLNNKISNLWPTGYAQDIATGSDTAVLDLMKVFPILTKVNCLPTSVFKNLSIEIEFEANAAQQILTTTTANTINIIRPVLAVDYITNPSIVGPMTSQLISQGVRWLEIEHDNYVMPQVDTSGYQNADSIRVANNNNSLGFVGKLVERLLVCKQIGNFAQELNGGTTVQGYSALASSQALLNQSVQIRLNGRNMLPGAQGLSGSNATLAQMADTFGEFSVNPCANQYKWDQEADINSGDLQSGQQDWVGVMLGARVQNLQLEIARDTQKDSSIRQPTNSLLKVNLFAEVHKAVSFQNGGYRIVYV